MVIEKQNIAAPKDDWLVPLWMKAVVTFFACAAALVFLLALASEQETLFGFPTRFISGAILSLLLVSIPTAIAFWFYPRSAIVVFLYWAIRSFRAQIVILAALGGLYLITIRAELFSVRGGIPAIGLILLLATVALVRPLGADRFPLRWIATSAARLDQLAERINFLPVRVLRALAAVLPVAIVCVVIYAGLDSSLPRYRPYSSWEDETAYWLRVRSFSHVGLNAGYNSPNEFVAPAAFSRYGEGSPLYVYLYGSIARLAGWTPHLPILINFTILAVAIFLFTYFARLDSLQVLFTGLIAVLTWPILSYLPMTTHETLNQALGFILAIVFLQLLTQRERVGMPARIFYVALVYLAALVRLSWGLLLVPVIFYSLEGRVWRRVIVAVLVGLGLYVSVMWITSYLVPPVNNSILLALQEGQRRGPVVFVERIADQFSQMFRSRQLTANIAVLFQIAVILGWSTIHLVRLVRARASAASVLQSGTVFDLYNMATLALSGLTFYLHAGFSRTFTPSILLVYLLLAARKDYRFLTTLLALNMVFFSVYLGPGSGAYRIMKEDFTTEFPQGAALQSTLETWIVYDGAAQDPWCNTLLVPLAYYDRRLTVVPPGIGVSFLTEDLVVETPLRSKYLLFDDKTYEQLEDRLNVQLLESSSLGDLYYNRDSGCKSNP